MKIKCLLFPFLTTCFLIISTSCDGSRDDESNLSLDQVNSLTANSLEELVPGDTILYTTSNNTVPILGAATFNTPLRATIGQQAYDYLKTGEFLFSITRRSEKDIFQVFEKALDNTLTDNGTNAQLGSRLRQLLRRQVAVYSIPELEEINRILLPSGTDTTVNSKGVLVTRFDDIYTHLVTSNRLTQDRGTMAGTYFLNSNTLDIDFRRPSTEEIAKYRFIEATNYWIPFVTERIERLASIQQGTWVLELQNSPN